MSLPKQVQEAADLAEKLHAQMFTKQESETKTEEAVTNTDTNEKQTAPTEDKEELQKDANVKVDEKQEVTEYDVPHDDDVEELRKFKARYLTLKGMYDADVPRLHKELNELKQSVFEKLQNVSVEDKKQDKEEDKDDFDIAAFEKEYSPEFVKQLQKFIAKEASTYVKPVKDQLASVEDSQIKAEQASFMAYLDDNVEGSWKDAWAGKDPKFIEFLQKTDPNGLYTYGELVKKYNEDWDAAKLSKVFNLYYKENKVEKSIVQEKESKNEAVINTKQKEAMIAPSRSTTAPANTADEKIIWTKAKMDEFQKLDRQGKYSKEESTKLWNDLLSALSENRIK